MKTRKTSRFAFPLIAVLLAVPVANTAGAQVLKNIGKALQDTGEAIGEGVDKAGEAIGKGVRNTGDALTGKNKEQPQSNVILRPSYLFVQQAGTMTYADGKLTLGELAPSTYYFADSPVRDAGDVSYKKFLDLWSGKAKGDFKAAPPSAAIAISGHETPETIVVELLTAERNGSELTYTVKVNTGTLPAEGKGVALFVDGTLGNAALDGLFGG